MDLLPFPVVSRGELDHLGPAGLRDKLAGPPQAALAWLGAAAAGGSLAAQTLLGQWFLEGRGVARDEARAFAWFKHAAHAGHAGAANLVGRCYENGWGTAAGATAAAHWYTVAAERGSDWGMYNLATSLALGRGLAPDRPAAFAWFRKAADLGHAKSLNIVGGFYEDGWEVPADARIAAGYYRRAAEAGDFRGQFNYARVLALAGNHAGAAAWIARVPDIATPAFIKKMLEYLRQAPQPELRRLYGVVQSSDCAARAANAAQT
ncbi:tetratricopeptide repeat protein [Cupriavidus sp. TMH.W2]|uniref:tetratricopeptide repeat protein n=1 Tax=Cupriavidus sp. TMH.W2 TaxID=3434465 RepID=UPI003D76EE39